MNAIPIKIARQSVLDLLEASLLNELSYWGSCWFATTEIKGKLYSPRTVKESIDGPFSLGDTAMPDGDWYELPACATYLKIRDHFADDLCSKLIQPKPAVLSAAQSRRESWTPEEAAVQASLAMRCVIDLAAAITGEDLNRSSAWTPMTEMDVDAGAIWAVLYLGGSTFSLVLVFDATNLVNDLCDSEDQPKEPVRPIQLQSLNHRFDVAATLGRLSLTIQQLKKLKMGDVIQLNRHLDDNIDVHAGEGVKLFKGSLGASGEVKALSLR